ncbi:MAG: phosphomannomutase/phosphoglucomutase [Clostridia bacterium]|nr:phosphomannomutase/phosphoglucomutase [Clostridia bacterium]
MTLQEWLKLKNGTDIRGTASEGVEGDKVTLTDDVVTTLSKAFYVWLQRRLNKKDVTVAVGYDSRISAPRLCACVQQGVTACGGTVVVTGLSSTPSMFMLLQKPDFGCDGSVMLTASHLPFQKNGMKFFVKEGGLESSDIQEIITLAFENSFPSGMGSVIHRSFMDEYCADLVALTQRETGEAMPLLGKKIIVDAGNGAGGFYATKVLQPLGADTAGSQFLEPDGTFPNHIPNPENKDAMRSICDAVKAEDADFGIIFDTDVDRAGAVDKDGKEINRNRLIALISAILLKEHAGAYIVTDSVTSDGLASFIREHGGVHHRFKRGYKNVINEAKRLCDEGKYAPLAIETSGHAALAENYFLDDGAYLVTKLLISLARTAKQGKELSSLISDLPMPAEEREIRPTFTDPDSDFKTLGKRIIEEITAWAESCEYITLAPDNFDGVRMNFDKAHGNGWVLVRMSLHEPIMPINLESEEVGGCQKLVKEIYGFLKEYKELNLTPFDKYL